MARSAQGLILSALLAKFALIAALYPHNPGALRLFDSNSYLSSARALRLVHKFSISPDRAAEPQVVRTPGYPALIAAVYALVGERPWVLAILNSLFSGVTALLVFRLTSSMAGSDAGNYAVFLYCIEPSTFHYGTLVMTEVPFTLCVVLALWFSERTLEDRSALQAAWCGAFLGVGTLVRPILTYAVAPWAAVLGLLLFKARLGWRRSLFCGVMCAASALALIVPWQIRNARVFGDASVSQVKNLNLYLFDAATIVADLRHESVRATQERFGLHELVYRFGFVPSEGEAFVGRGYAELYPGRAMIPLLTLAHSCRDTALSILVQHPARALLDRAVSLWQLLWVPSTISWAYQYGLFDAGGKFTQLWVYPHPFQAMLYLARRDAGLVVVSIAFLLPVVAIYFLAWKGIRRSSGAFRTLLLVSLAYFLVVSTVPGYPDDRLRIPFIPILCVFAGIGLVTHARRFQGATRPSVIR